MARQWKNDFLAELHAAYEAVYVAYEQQTQHLDERQLNWKPNADKWSVAECLQHLIITAEGYLPQVAKQLDDANLRRVKGKEGYQTTFFGKIFLGFLDPESARKLSAPKMFKPEASQYDRQIVTQHLTLLRKIMDCLKEADGYILNRLIIKSPAAWFIRFNMGDYFKIELLHHQRHLIQIKKTIALEEFPKA
jgi:hypothetical protein